MYMTGELLKCPISGLKADEQINEKEAKIRKYLDLQFMMKYLEDENESVKIFLIDTKRIIVHMTNPILQYKKKPIPANERLQTLEFQKEVNNSPVVPTPVACSLDDSSDCLVCGS